MNNAEFQKIFVFGKKCSDIVLETLEIGDSTKEEWTYILDSEVYSMKDIEEEFGQDWLNRTLEDLEETRVWNELTYEEKRQYIERISERLQFDEVDHLECFNSEKKALERKNELDKEYEEMIGKTEIIEQRNSVSRFGEFVDVRKYK